MINLIGISGKIGSGKDEVVRIVNEITSNAYQVKRFSGKLKQIVELMTGVPADQMNRQDVKTMSLGPEWDYMTVRDLLIRIGTEGMRDRVHKDAWVNALFNDYDDRKYWIVPDTRFPNEFNAIRNRGGIVVRIERPGVKCNGHESETAIDGFDFDYVLKNDGTLDDLQRQVLEMLAHFRIISGHRVGCGVIV